MGNKWFKLESMKLVLLFGVLFMLYVVASDLLKIAYLEFKGVYTVGKIITLEEKEGYRRLDSKSYIPLVRIEVDGKEVNSFATLNKVSHDLVDFVGEEVKIKYSPNNYNMLIIKDKKFFLEKIIYLILAIQLLVFVFLGFFMKKSLEREKNREGYKIKKIPFLNLILLFPGLVFSLLWIYYQFTLGEYALKPFDYIGALATSTFLGVYMIILYTFIKKKKFKVKS